MNRKEFIRLLKSNGWWLKREGGDHTIYTNGKAIEPIPRQNELNERLVQAIIKRRGLK